MFCQSYNVYWIIKYKNSSIKNKQELVFETGWSQWMHEDMQAWGQDLACWPGGHTPPQSTCIQLKAHIPDSSFLLSWTPGATMMLLVIAVLLFLHRTWIANLTPGFITAPVSSSFRQPTRGQRHDSLSPQM